MASAEIKSPGTALMARRACSCRLCVPRVAIVPAGAETCGFARECGRLADDVAARPAHQVHVHVILVIGVGTGCQYCREHRTGGVLDIVQESLLLRGATPAILDGDGAPIRKREGRDI